MITVAHCTCNAEAWVQLPVCPPYFIYYILTMENQSQTQVLVSKVSGLVEEVESLRSSEDYGEYGRELSLVITKLQEASLWLGSIDNSQIAA